MENNIVRPDYYGKEENPFEPIKIIEYYDLGFHLGNVVKYVLRQGIKTQDGLPDLKKALWYLQRQINLIESSKQQKNGN